MSETASTEHTAEQFEADTAKSTVEAAETVSQAPEAEPASGVAPLQVPEKKLDTPLDPSTCTTCKKLVTAENSVVLVRCPKKMPLARRCKACHTLKSRINRVTSKHGNLAEDWTNVTDEQKREFYKKYQDSMGENLVARMQETVTESKRVASSVEFVGTGEYFDEADMNEKYQGKPEQLANIMANTRSIFCPLRQVWLYEDVKYKRTAKDSEEVSCTDKRKRQGIPIDQCQDANASGSGGSKKKKGQGKAESDLPKLKAGEKKKIGKKMEALNTKRLQLMDWSCKAKSDKPKTLVPIYVLEAADKVVDECTAFTTDIEATLESNHGNTNEILEGVESRMETVAECAARVKCQVDQAQAFLNTQAK